MKFFIGYLKKRHFLENCCIFIEPFEDAVYLYSIFTKNLIFLGIFIDFFSKFSTFIPYFPKSPMILENHILHTSFCICFTFIFKNGMFYFHILFLNCSIFNRFSISLTLIIYSVYVVKEKYFPPEITC